MSINQAGNFKLSRDLQDFKSSMKLLPLFQTHVDFSTIFYISYLRKEFDVKEYRENLRITAQACIMNTMYCD